MAEPNLTDEGLDDDIIGEPAEYSHKSEFKKPFLVQEAMQRTMIARSKEMRPGYINTTRSSDGTISQTTTPDSRQEFVNSVKALAILVAPEIKADKKAKEKAEVIKKEERELWNQLAYEDMVIKKDGANYTIKKTGFKFMPQMDAILQTDIVKSQEVVSAKGYWNNKVSLYWEKLVELYDRLFEEVSILIASEEVNYFKPKQSW